MTIWCDTQWRWKKGTQKNWDIISTQSKLFNLSFLLCYCCITCSHPSSSTLQRDIFVCKTSTRHIFHVPQPFFCLRFGDHYLRCITFLSCLFPTVPKKVEPKTISEVGWCSCGTKKKFKTFLRLAVREILSLSIKFSCLFSCWDTDTVSWRKKSFFCLSFFFLRLRVHLYAIFFVYYEYALMAVKLLGKYNFSPMSSYERNFCILFCLYSLICEFYWLTWIYIYV